jgi:hypothetical protein
VFATTQVSALNPDQGRPPWSGLHSPSKRPKRFAAELRRAVAYPFRPITRSMVQTAFMAAPSVAVSGDKEFRNEPA